MHWYHNDVGDLSIVCTVCNRQLNKPDYTHGIYYFPDGLTDEQHKEIAEIWHCDPPDLAMCEDCMDGHCGAVAWRTPDQWLEKKWTEYHRQ